MAFQLVKLKSHEALKHTAQKFPIDLKPLETAQYKHVNNHARLTIRIIIYLRLDLNIAQNILIYIYALTSSILGILE